MSNILLHLSTKNKIYAGICNGIVKNLNENIYSANLHECLLDTVEECAADVVVLPLYEYTKEFHAFVSTTKKKIILILSADIPKNFIDNTTQALSNKNNIVFISRTKIANNCILYDNLYDNEIFYDYENKNRLNKIAVLLHNNDEVNNKLLPILYPHSKNIVCFNNSNFNHPTNIGQISIGELAKILNEYEYVLDLSDIFSLESMACGCGYINNDHNNLIENIKNKTVLKPLIKLEEKTFRNFIVKNNFLLQTLGVS